MFSVPGVAGVSGLHGAEDFMPLAVAAVANCDRLRAEISSGAVSSSPLGILRGVDAISNGICSVIDAADFLRNTHADSTFREAADAAFNHLAEYIQELNTDDSLYRALCGAVSDSSAMKALSEEQRRVAKLHIEEYERGGIHLSGEDRAEVVTLQSEVTRLESLFEYNIVAKRASFQVPRNLLQGVPEYVLSRIPQPAGQPHDSFTLPTDQSVMTDVLKTAHNGQVRRAMFLAGSSVAAENVQVLEQLMAARHMLAKKVGFESHAHRVISDKMAGSPEEVSRFLEALDVGTKERAEREMEMLRDAKLQAEGTSELFLWDLAYYMGVVKSRQCNLSGSSLAEYFTLKSCLEGLSLICRGLFGISLDQVPMSAGENWAPGPSTGAGGSGRDAGGGVRKLVLRHSTEGVLGTVYLDLHRRDGKYGHAAHFTVRCGCVVHQGGEDITTALDAGTGSSNNVLEYQLPVVVLVCNFALPDGGTGDDDNDDASRLMAHSEVETLFHEFGHALHSLLSRTEFQHVSGTRVPVDFCEIPSHLLEHFVWDRSFLIRFARHYQTGKAFPTDVVDRLRASKTLFAGMETRTQLLYAALDQKLFGPQPDGGGVLSSTSVANTLRESITGIRNPEGALWHSRFGHFTGYGAGYYAYLYAKMFTSAIWQRHFATDPLNRQSGELLWKELMMHGGARDPHRMLRALLDDAGGGGEEGVRAGIESMLKDMDISSTSSQ